MVAGHTLIVYMMRLLLHSRDLLKFVPSARHVRSSYLRSEFYVISRLLVFLLPILCFVLYPPHACRDLIRLANIAYSGHADVRCTVGPRTVLHLSPGNSDSRIASMQNKHIAILIFLLLHLVHG